MPIQEAERVGGSFKFVSSRKATFRGRTLTADLSRFNGLSLLAANFGQSPLLVGIKLVHGHGHGRDLPPVSLSGGREELAPGERRELEFPHEAFGVYGFPVGWSHIREVEVTFSVERCYPIPGSIQVSIGPLQARIRKIPVGPRLSREGLKGLLTKDVPGVTSFFDRSGGDAGNVGIETQKEATWYPYAPANPGLLIPPPHTYPKDRAEEILDGRIMGSRIGHPVDWDANPSGELEWRHFLHRHHFMRELVKEFANSGHDRYAKALDGMISSWIHANPVPVGSNGGAGPSWETLSAAWRLREWLWVAGIAWPNEYFGQDTKINMMCSVWEHARSLVDHRGHPNNWIIVESAALALAGLCFPEFKEASQWLKIGLERLRDEFRRQFFSDGVHFEISPLYHAICVHALLEVKQAAEAKGVELPEEFYSPLEKCFEYLVGLRRPDFTWPSINDSGGVTSDYTALLGLAGQVFHRPDFVWVGSRGACGAAAEKASRFFPHAGIAAMRSDHSEDANLLMFRAGPPGASHVHNDSLSLDVTALGVPRLADPGITSYAPGPMTDYYRSAWAHNMFLIDGKEFDRSGFGFHEKIKPAGEDFHWKCLDDLEVATGICRGWGSDGGQAQRSGLLARTVVFVRREYWVVRDVAFGEGSHEITACWQFFPGPVEVDSKTHVAVCLGPQGQGFELIPVPEQEEFRTEIVAGSLHPPGGWVSLNGADVPATAFRHTVRAPLPRTMIWLLLPFSGTPRSGVTVNRIDSGGGDILVEITLQGRETGSLAFPSPPADCAGITAEQMHAGIALQGRDY
ncbi:MAG: alginate lyase family protein [Desulfomonile tiedjei]|nr:alginate lyase family protein [Desulfomonile tiedjei]